MKPLFALAIVVATALGCAHAPKPKELLDLQALRDQRDYLSAQEKQPQLVKQSDEAYWKAVEAWKDEDLEITKYWANLGSIKLRTALSILRIELGRQRVETGRKQLVEVRTQHQDLKVKLAEAEEQLRLHDKLASARQSAKAQEEQLKAKLSEAEQRELEQKRLGEAQLALKMADTVEAAKYAPNEYGVAQALLVRAEAAVKEGKGADVIQSLEAAKLKADAAFNAARPLYMAARKTAERQARNQALQKDAAAVTGVTVRMKAIGETQQLILPVTALFKRSASAPDAGKVSILNEIGVLLKRYPEYPIIINGYTSSRVRASQQYAVSHARASAVANHFTTLGVEFKRLVVAGRGAADFIGPKASPQNDRVEVIVLFQ